MADFPFDALSAWIQDLVQAEVATALAARDGAGEQPYLTVPEVADLLRTTRGRVDYLLSIGKLTRVKEGRRTLIERDEVIRYLAQEKTGPLGAEIIRLRQRDSG